VFYQMTASYAETSVKNSAGQWGGHFWIQAEQGGVVSDSCGNAPGLNVYGVAFNWCLNSTVSGFYWITISSGVNGQDGIAEDWATNMGTPPEGS
jgi:hypothetical protein